jgi:hypothetical protein
VQGGMLVPLPGAGRWLAGGGLAGALEDGDRSNASGAAGPGESVGRDAPLMAEPGDPVEPVISPPAARADRSDG